LEVAMSSLLVRHPMDDETAGPKGRRFRVEMLSRFWFGATILLAARRE
jgi:hypothetical protein